MIRALCCSSSLSGLVFPFLLGKLTSGIPHVSTAALGSIEAAVRARHMTTLISLQQLDNYPACIALMPETRWRHLGLDNVFLIFWRLQELYGMKLCMEQVHTNTHTHVYMYGDTDTDYLNLLNMRW